MKKTVLLILLLAFLLPLILGSSQSGGCGGINFGAGSPPDTAPPGILSYWPCDGAAWIPLDATVYVHFLENLNSRSVNESTFFVRDEFNNSVPGTIVTYGVGRFKFTPSDFYSPNTTYEIILTTGIADTSGNHLSGERRWSFTTGPLGVGNWQRLDGLPHNMDKLYDGGSQMTAHYHGFWTGSKVLFYSLKDYGTANFSYETTLIFYDPTTDTWEESQADNNPPTSPIAVWSGTDMIVWGYKDTTTSAVRYTNEGAIYNLSSDTWHSIATTGAPSRRRDVSAVWTGTEMIIWGGASQENLGIQMNDGASYNPSTDSWREISLQGAPEPRYKHAAVWTDKEMVVWGGMSDSPDPAWGGKYDPVSDTWQSIPTGPPGTPTGFWTGTEIIFFGDDVRSYNPDSNSWKLFSYDDAPPLVKSRIFVWAGDRVILIQGKDNIPIRCMKSGYDRLYGGMFFPSTGNWEPTSTLFNAPDYIFTARAVWTGNEVIVGRDRDNEVIYKYTP